MSDRNVSSLSHSPQYVIVASFGRAAFDVKERTKTKIRAITAIITPIINNFLKPFPVPPPTPTGDAGGTFILGINGFVKSDCGMAGSVGREAGTTTVSCAISTPPYTAWGDCVSSGSLGSIQII